MDKKVDIFSPCDGSVDEIINMKDGVFSEKMLGDGFYLKPSNNTFSSPLDEGWLENVFETKHAFHFKNSDGIIVLMHIGLDTVKLNGAGFNVIHNVKEKVNKETNIVEIDREFLTSKNVDLNTPLVFEIENDDYKINFVKKGNVKKGEKIAELILNISEKKKDILSSLNVKNKFEEAAEVIEKSVGSYLNVKKSFNCMTRFRLIVKDKSLIDEKEIKNLSLVKGINWSGEELQIIIGGDAYKVREAFQNFTNKLTKKISDKSVKKTSLKQKVLGFISGVIIPVLPIMITAGLLKALQAVLEQTKAIQKVSISMKPGDISKLITDYDLGSAIVFIIANIGLAFLGVAFVISTVNYFKGNIYIALFIGITLMNPYLTGGLSWELFKIGDVSIKVQSYATSIIPMVFAGILYIYLDKWIKMWMPATVDIIFRPLLAYLLTVLPVIFVMGPILGIIESGIYYAMTWIGNIPYGFGAAIFSFAWQFLVITGLHTAINGFINLGIANNQPSVLGLCFTLTVFAQMGAGLGMLLRTKNSNSKKAILAALPATWFGITEPILYGSTLPKFRPFLMGCIGAGIGGLFIGITPATSYTVSAGGIFAVLRVVEGGWLQVGLYVLSWFITIGASMLLTILFYKERNSETSETKKVNKLLVKIYANWKSINTKESRTILNDKLNKVKNLLNSENLKKIKELDKLMCAYQKVEVSIKTKKEKNDSRIDLLIKKARRCQEKNNLSKLKVINDKYIKLSEVQNLDLLNKLELLKKEKLELENQVNDIQENYIKVAQSLLSEIAKEINHPFIINLQMAYFNAIHSYDISYMLTEKQDVDTKYSNYKILSVNK
ncbi:PTS system, sucrose-specific IIBC component [Spiroplasma helicoides]|uniref:PTS system, sucrose-specific IIBC component n=1 Tax=Spiroplasma helicoides TaxID=216938 RepID=A0A1B3SLV8_9MOLU|nr:glucose PTS transporter subunit IIA [Spiroplasma helicoides]AOG60926.1 PTS system, sucrose-specific IIBC component [Spiroplasma helicoides]